MTSARWALLLVAGVAVWIRFFAGEGTFPWHERTEAPPSPPRDVASTFSLSFVRARGRVPTPRRTHPKMERLHRKVEKALEDHDFGAARSLAERMLRTVPHDSWASGVLADSLLELGEVDGAEEVVQRILDIRPTGAFYFRASYLLHLRGKTRKAIETMQMAFEAFDPRFAWARALALAELGNLHWHRGDLDMAAREYGRSLAIHSGLAAARIGLARLAAARGRFAEAVLRFEAAADSPALLAELAAVYEAAGEPDQARRCIQRALRAGRDPALGRSLALCLADRRLQPEEAVRLAREEARRRPAIHSWDALAWALAAAGRFAEALDAAGMATALGTPEPLLLFHAGAAAAGAGHRERAREWLAHALALNPVFHVAHARTARTLLRRLGRE